MGRTGVVTIRDVARECGYSASTVSIVLNALRYRGTSPLTQKEESKPRRSGWGTVRIRWRGRCGANGRT